MTDLINRGELTSSIVNRQAKIPDILPYRDFKSWLDGYTACQHDILDIIESAKPVALGTDRVVINWTPDLDKFARDVAYRALNEFSYMGKSLLEWVDIILEQYAMKTQSGWISVQDRQPDLEEQVVIVCEWKGISGEKYREIVLDSFKAMRFLGYKPLFWMSVPEPPQEVSENDP